MNRHQSPQAFTLIELLVVVTIIVVLIALLMPALDKAIHQATLVQCAANQDGILGGLNLYAMSFNRYYPKRPPAPPDNYPFNIRDLTHWQEQARRVSGPDLRPIVRDFIPVKMFNDPFLRTWDFDSPTPDRHLLASYELWFGDTSPTSGAGIKRIGGAFRQQVDTNGDGLLDSHRNFQVLIKDQYIASSATDLLGAPVEGTSSSHPDDTGLMSEVTGEDENSDVERARGIDGTYSYYKQDGTPPESVGGIDQNVGFTDGSVVRYGGTRWERDSKTVFDNAGHRHYKVGYWPHFLPGN